MAQLIIYLEIDEIKYTNDLYLNNKNKKHSNFTYLFKIYFSQIIHYDYSLKN